MMPVPFDPATDLATTPFDERHLLSAQELKRRGLPFNPHVGCFVWDPQKCIAADSPFPSRVYFILSLPRFLDIFGSKQSMIEKLVWLPTWHQSRLLGRTLGIGDDRMVALWHDNPPPSPGDELLQLYQLLLDALKR
jgi:hypothetical protein